MLLVRQSWRMTFGV